LFTGDGIEVSSLRSTSNVPRNGAAIVAVSVVFLRIPTDGRTDGRTGEAAAAAAAAATATAEPPPPPPRSSTPRWLSPLEFSFFLFETHIPYELFCSNARFLGVLGTSLPQAQFIYSL